jgi:hypothetical protein
MKGCKNVNTENENKTCDNNLCVDLQTRKSKKLSIPTDLTLEVRLSLIKGVEALSCCEEEKKRVKTLTISFT